MKTTVHTRPAVLALLALVVAPAVTPVVYAAPQGATTTVEITAADGKNVLAINGNEGKQTIDAAGRDVSVNGNRNQIVLSGECRTLTVIGNDNTVVVDGVASIALPGNRNQVAWAKAVAGGETPTITDLGNGNRVARQPAR